MNSPSSAKRKLLKLVFLDLAVGVLGIVSFLSSSPKPPTHWILGFLVVATVILALQVDNHQESINFDQASRRRQEKAEAETQSLRLDLKEAGKIAVNTKIKHEGDLLVAKLEGALTAIYKDAIFASDISGANRGFRLCVHHRINDDKWLQFTNYVGDGCRRNKGRGRTFLASKGVVGRVLRMQSSWDHAHAKDAADRRTVLLEYGYTQTEIDSGNKAARGWFACTIGEPGDKFAVLYADSPVVGFFGNAVSKKRKVLLDAVVAIAQILIDANIKLVEDSTQGDN